MATQSWRCASNAAAVRQLSAPPATFDLRIAELAGEKEKRPEGRFSTSLLRRLLALLFVALRQLLADPRRFPRAPTQVVELGPPYVPFALHLDAGDQRRVRLEGSLHPFTARDLAHHKRRIEPAV